MRIVTRPCPSAAYTPVSRKISLELMAKQGGIGLADMVASGLERAGK